MRATTRPNRTRKPSGSTAIAELFEKLGGQALAVQSSGLTRSGGPLLAGCYRDAPHATFERRARLDPLDLRAQQTGEAYVLRGTAIVRATLFFAGAFRLAEYRVNRFAALAASEEVEPAGRPRAPPHRGGSPGGLGESVGSRWFRGRSDAGASRLTPRGSVCSRAGSFLLFV